MPEVTGVSPNKGPVQGGQRVVLRGSYLGDGPQDVVQVLVAGVDCTASLEYFSSCELFLHNCRQNYVPLCSKTGCGDCTARGSRQWACGCSD